MAISVISTPRYNHSGFLSDAASTEQLLYHFNENDLVGKESYVLKVVIPELDDLTNFYVPDSNGDIVFDIGKWVQLAMGDTPLIDFKITYNGQWRGGSTAPADTIFIMAVNSRRQMYLNTAGANLFDYMMNEDLSIAGHWMTVFEEPVVWVDRIQGVQIINQDRPDFDVKEDLLDVNKQQISTSENQITGQDVRQLYFVLNLFFSLPSPYVRYTILDTNPSQTPISQSIIIKVREQCANSIFLQWRNSLGSTDWWMFEYEQAVTMVASEGLKVEIPITRPLYNTPLGTIGNKFRAGSTTTQHITLKADQLTRNQIEGLHDIKTSNLVHLVNDNNREVVVIVSSGFETSYTTGKTGYVFTLSVELPDNFDFFKFVL